MKVLHEHSEACEEQGKECCPEDKYIKVKVSLLSEVGMIDETDGSSSDSLALFVTCECCAFLDFVTLC